jgi:hypothetical protein
MDRAALLLRFLSFDGLGLVRSLGGMNQKPASPGQAHFRQQVVRNVFRIRGLKVPHQVEDKLGLLEGPLWLRQPLDEPYQDFLAVRFLPKSDLFGRQLGCYLNPQKGQERDCPCRSRSLQKAPESRRVLLQRFDPAHRAPLALH